MPGGCIAAPSTEEVLRIMVGEPRESRYVTVLRKGQTIRRSSVLEESASSLS